MGETHPTPAENTSELSRRLEGKEPVNPGNDIDARMASLNAEHIEMGARPAEEPGSGDIHEATYPLKEKAGSSLPASMTEGTRKAAPKKRTAKKK